MKNGRRIHFLLIAALVAALWGTSGGSAETGGALDRKLSLDLWGAGLNDFAVAVKAATGVDIVFYLPDLSPEKNRDNVYIVTGEVTLGTVLEAMARRFAFRFRVSGSGRVELSRSYGWVGREAGLRFARMGCLAGEGGCTVEGMRGFLAEFVKPLPLLSGDFALRLERYPMPDDPGAFRAAAVMPRELGGYLERGIECLSGDGGDYPSRSLRPGEEGLFARARLYDNDWEGLLSRPVETPRGEGIRALLLEVARQTRTAVVLRAPPSREGRLPGDVVR